MKKSYIVTGMIAAIMASVQACSKMEPSAPPSELTLDAPLEGLSYAQIAQHAAGDEIFENRVFTSENGLGPVFVATSCESCHAGDGKGVPFTTLTRFGQSDTTGNKFLAQGGPQLQSRALPGYQPEQIPAGATSTRLMPPAVTGLGFIEAVPDSTILAMAQANLSNPNGVRGHPNWNTIPEDIGLTDHNLPGLEPDANSMERDGKYICRFGKKAAVYSLLHQAVSALNQDIGITSTFDPLDVYTLKYIDPEITDKEVRDLTFYLQTEQAPIPRDQDAPIVKQGKTIFMQVGCADCHRETLKTGYSPITPLAYKEFHPYTDLLVHDMGPGLDDGYTEGTAKTSEWRTAPLWGLGVSPRSQGGTFYLLHDGRAHSIEEAIEMHGGEAATAKSNFEQLSATDKAALIKFLKSL